MPSDQIDPNATYRVTVAKPFRAYGLVITPTAREVLLSGQAVEENLESLSSYTKVEPPA